MFSSYKRGIHPVNSADSQLDWVRAMRVTVRPKLLAKILATRRYPIAWHTIQHYCVRLVKLVIQVTKHNMK